MTIWSIYSEFSGCKDGQDMTSVTDPRTEKAPVNFFSTLSGLPDMYRIAVQIKSKPNPIS